MTSEGSLRQDRSPQQGESLQQEQNIRLDGNTSQEKSVQQYGSLQQEQCFHQDDLAEQLREMGLQGTETILIHSSMKSIGMVEGGADAVLDVWQNFFRNGLLLLPTHTWKTVNEACPVFDPKVTECCVGILPELFRTRPGVVRSLHPTHSIAAFGKDAVDYVKGEENNNTPCTPGGVYDRLRDRQGKILLVGVGHERNTFIHSVEEVLNVPNRLAERPVKLQIKMSEGVYRTVYMRKHYNPHQPHISEDFVKMHDIYLQSGVAQKVRFGQADCLLCDAVGIFEVTRKALASWPECLVEDKKEDIENRFFLESLKNHPGSAILVTPT